MRLRGRAAAKRHRVKRGVEFFAGQRAFDINLQRDGFAAGKLVQHAGNGPGNARAHQHIIHAREHRAEDGRQRGKLDFFQEVNADHAGVAFLGKKNFRKICGHGQRHKVWTGIQARHG